MSSESRVLWFVVMLFVSSFVDADMAQYKADFLNPPDSAKPHTWWHWMNDNISKEGLTADLEAMAEVGVGGAQIFNVGGHVPVGTVDYMSEEWIEMVRHAVSEAKRVGVEICMHNCAGWSCSGGPWITPEYSMKIISFSETNVIGPGSVSVRLQNPESSLDFYRDICILAFPTPEDDSYRLVNISVKAGFESRYGVGLDIVEVPDSAIISSDTVVDITHHMNPYGRLNWDCPSGRWTIMRIGYTTTGKTNHPASDSGIGLECDKLSRSALDVHWNNGIKPVLDKLGDLAGPVMNNILVDSYEVGCNNWTQGFGIEFEQRRGYNLIQYLPVLTGRVVDSAGISERFLWDYRRTISDLFRDNYYGYFADKCHEKGLLCSVEPYDGPFECLSIASKADILMGEFWAGEDQYAMSKSIRLASSVAHTHGQQIIGAESFTSGYEDAAWVNHPRSLKKLGDDVWCDGINRFIFHTSTHQPWLDQWPGMTMGMYGTHFERTNTWWKDGAAWMEYIARSQSILQAGRFYSDVLYFAGEFVPQGAVYNPELKEIGYDYDSIGTDLFEVLAVADGEIILPSGMRYKLLVMPNTQTMSVAVAEKVKKLVERGATVLGPKPERVPSLACYPESEDELRLIAYQVWGQSDSDVVDLQYGDGRILSGYSVEQALMKMNLAPDFMVVSENFKMDYIHRIIDDADVYFVSNQSGIAQKVCCRFRVSGKVPELWDAQRCTVTKASLWKTTDSYTEVSFDLGEDGSVFVVFDELIVGSQDTYVKIEREGGSSLPEMEYPPLELEVVKAEYGILNIAFENTIDVADELNSLIEDNVLSVLVDNNLAGDPALGTAKSILVEYIYDGLVYVTKMSENQVLQLPPSNLIEGKKLEVSRAIYGVIPDDISSIPEPVIIDITDRVNAQITNNKLEVKVTNELAGADPAPYEQKQLLLVYRIDGVELTSIIYENDMIQIPEYSWRATPWPATICQINGLNSLLIWDDGNYHLIKASGEKSVVTVASTEPQVQIEGSWNLCFTNSVNIPEPVVLTKLESLSDHKNRDIQTFSGTAIYQKQISVPDSWLTENKRVVLDLGQVEVMARVIINGSDLGVLWCNPYRLDITDVLIIGNNQIEIQVTNQWVNRLIGDESYPDDCNWGWGLVEWPQWLLDGTSRPSQQRTTFASWKHWDADDTLLPSGLVGPVYIRVGQIVPISGLYGDFTNNGIVNIDDAAYFVKFWLEGNSIQSSWMDLDGNNSIDLYEFSEITRCWNSN